MQGNYTEYLGTYAHANGTGSVGCICLLEALCSVQVPMVIPLLKQQDYPGDLNLTKVLIASPALQERDSACPAECSF